MLKFSFFAKLSNSLITKHSNRLFGIKTFFANDLGEGVEDMTVTELFVKEGDTVTRNQKILQVEMAKGVKEYPCPFDGKLVRLLVKESQECKIGTALYEVEVNENDTEQELKDTKDQPKIDLKNVESTIYTNRIQNENVRNSDESMSVLATPAVRKIAKDLHIPLELVKGTGTRGNVLKEDVLNLSKFINQNHSLQPSVSKEQVNPNQNSGRTTGEFIQIAKPMTFTEKSMVKSMTHAATVPHFYLHEEFDIEDLFSLRGKLKEAGINISLFALVVKSFSLALSENPKMNSNYHPEKDQFTYIENNQHNISIAIDSKHGLFAPNVKNVELMSSEEIDKEIKILKDLAEQNKIPVERFQNGTIAISNVGTISGYLATPLNLPGQVCIVAVGKVVVKPIWNDKKKEFEPKHVLPVSFGCDHRVLDGATVARFSKRWRHYIEEPYLIFSKLK